MEEISLPCLFCAGPIDDERDYCSRECEQLHLSEQVVRLSGRVRIARCGHVIPCHPGRSRRWCDLCRESQGKEPQTWRITCRGCGRFATAGHHFQRYCTTECRAETLRKEQRAIIEAQRKRKACTTCGRSLAGRHSTAKFCTVRCANIARGTVRAEPLARRVCALAECDVEFQPYREGQRCCCEKHGRLLCGRERRADGRESASEWNDSRRDAYHRRRALKKAAATGDPVRLTEIAARDKHKCHLCGERVPKEAWPHPLSPSLDHVVPLSKGGAHDPSNVKLAHLRCNTAKGNRGGGEQLLLIG